MPNISSTPLQIGNDLVTKYEGSATTSLQTFTFPSIQETTVIVNEGIRPIKVMLLGKTYTIPPNTARTFTENTGSFQIASEQDAQPFRVEGRVSVLDNSNEITRKILNAKYVAFTFSNSADTKLVLMTSDDGVDFKAINPNGSFTIPTDKLRDPAVLKVQDYYYILHSKCDYTMLMDRLGLIRTKDFINFEIMPDIPTGFQRAWAPEFFVGSNGVVLILFTGQSAGQTNFKPYYITVTNNMSTFSAPVEITGTGLATNMIDLHGVELNGTTYIWYKNEDTKYIEIIHNDGTGYKTFKSGDWAGWGSNLEGAYLVKMQDRWRVYIDNYPNSKMYYSDSFDNWNTWTTKKETKADFLGRHLTILENQKDSFYLKPPYDHNKDYLNLNPSNKRSASRIEIDSRTAKGISIITDDTGSATSWEAVKIQHDRTSEGRGVITNMEFAKDNVMRIYNITGSAPTSNPSGSGFLFVENGALKYKGANGTVTTIAPS